MKGVESIRIQLLKGFWNSRKIPGLDYLESWDRDFQKNSGSRDNPGFRRGLVMAKLVVISNNICAKLIINQLATLGSSSKCFPVYPQGITLPRIKRLLTEQIGNKPLRRPPP